MSIKFRHGQRSREPNDGGGGSESSDSHDVPFMALYLHWMENLAMGNEIRRGKNGLWKSWEKLALKHVAVDSLENKGKFRIGNLAMENSEQYRN